MMAAAKASRDHAADRRTTQHQKVHFAKRTVQFAGRLRPLCAPEFILDRADELAGPVFAVVRAPGSPPARRESRPGRRAVDLSAITAGGHA
jgi:hypothetical protein